MASRLEITNPGTVYVLNSEQLVCFQLVRVLSVLQTGDEKVVV